MDLTFVETKDLSTSKNDKTKITYQSVKCSILVIVKLYF